MDSEFDIADWIETNLARAAKSAGDEWTFVCPWCEKWSTAYCNAETGAYICFACGNKGQNIVGLVAEVEGVTWSEAKKWLFKRTVKLRRKSDLFTLSDRIRGLRTSDTAGEALESDTVAFDLPRGFRPVWKDGKWSLPLYLKERRIKSETARRWGMGYCRFGDYANRLIIPIECPNGYSFTARTMEPDVEPRYKNPPGADHRRLLIGWNVARTRGDLCIVEGPLDAVRFDQHGIASLAVGGKVLHSEQMAMLFKLKPSQAVTVCLDPEELMAPLDVASQLAVHFERIYIARLPMGVDPGDSTRTQAMEALSGAERFSGGRAERVRARLSGAKTVGDRRFGK